MSRRVVGVVAGAPPGGGGVRMEAFDAKAAGVVTGEIARGLGEVLDGVPDGASRDVIRCAVAAAMIAGRTAGLSLAEVERAVSDGARMGREAVPVPASKGGVS